MQERDDVSARLRLGDPTALEEVIDRYGAYAAKIIAAYQNRVLPPEDRKALGSPAEGVTDGNADSTIPVVQS